MGFTKGLGRTTRARRTNHPFPSQPKQLQKATKIQIIKDSETGTSHFGHALEVGPGVAGFMELQKFHGGSRKDQATLGTLVATGPGSAGRARPSEVSKIIDEFIPKGSELELLRWDSPKPPG